MIPAFDHNHVLPPHIGDPGIFTNLSPYECTTTELANRFGTSNERIVLLKNFLNFRNDLRNSGLAGDCFQWVDGSFVENKEVMVGSAPNDIDVITYIYGYHPAHIAQIAAIFPALHDRRVAKVNYKLDHIPIQIDNDPLGTYYLVKCYTMLFNHSRKDNVWKGILEVKLNTPADDAQALGYLNTL